MNSSNCWRATGMVALCVSVSCGGRSANDAAANGGAAGNLASAGSAGSSPEISLDAIVPSPGCGQPATQALAQYVEHSLHAEGKTLDPAVSVKPYDRSYYVWLPRDYDSSKPYRTTFLFPGCGSRYDAGTLTYKLMVTDPESIYVAVNPPPEGLPPVGKDCFDNTAGLASIEWEFMGLIGTQVQHDYCVDENRVFVAGASSGAWVSNMFGCYFAGKNPKRRFGPELSVRGQSGTYGGPATHDTPCGGPIAALWLDDAYSKGEPIAGDLYDALPRVLAADACVGGADGAQEPWGSSPALSDVCRRFTGCPSAYPVIFCTTQSKGQSFQDNLALPGFIEFQNLLNPK